MPFLFGKAYRRFGKNYFLLYVAFEFVSAFIVCLATLGLFALYTDQSASEFWAIAAFAEVCVALSTGFILWSDVPRELTLRVGWQPFLLIGVPTAARQAASAPP